MFNTFVNVINVIDCHIMHAGYKMVKLLANLAGYDAGNMIGREHGGNDNGVRASLCGVCVLFAELA